MTQHTPDKAEHIADIDCGNDYYISLHAFNSTANDEQVGASTDIFVEPGELDEEDIKAKMRKEFEKHPPRFVRRYEVVAHHAEEKHTQALQDIANGHSQFSHTDGVFIDSIVGDVRYLDAQLNHLAQEFEKADITIPKHTMRQTIQNDMQKYSAQYRNHLPR